MNLRTYLCSNEISKADFASRIGVSLAALYRYMSGDRVPHRKVMNKISEETKGEVTPNDFFVLSDAA